MRRTIPAEADAPSQAFAQMEDMVETSRDDLGRSYLETHPRGAEWLQLDVTVAALTFDHMVRLADVWSDTTARQQARARLLEFLGFFHGRLGSRWVRWADTFGLPAPPVGSDPHEVVTSPYRLQADPELGEYLHGVLPLYDAAIAILAGDNDHQGDYELLSAPWRQVCLPSPFTPANLFGEHTQPALASLAAAPRFPRSCLARMVKARRCIDDTEWTAATAAVGRAAIDLGYPYRGRSLYWEAVATAEAAMDESPTSPLLAQALWGYAAAHAFQDHLQHEVTALLKTPYRAGGRVPPPV